MGSGEYDAKALVRILREHFVTFGVAVEIASDGRPQMVASEVEKSLSRWGVRHRVSSSYYPHSNKWDKSGVIVECKPHNQVNVMMDGSRKVSLRSRQFVRKKEVPVPVVYSGVKPSQFICSQYDEVADVQNCQEGSAGLVEHENQRQVPEDRNDVLAEGRADDGGGALIDHQVNNQDDDRGLAHTAVDHQPVVRAKRSRKPNSKYDPAVYDFNSVQLREIPLRGKKNGWKGVYWPQ